MVVIDLETISCADLKAVGSVAYAAHPSTNISIFGWRDPKTKKFHTLVNPKLGSVKNSTKALTSFKRILKMKDIKIVAHNAPFEMEIIQNNMAKFIYDLGIVQPCKWIKATSESYLDTQTLSNIFRGPASLDNASKFFKTSTYKDSTGNALMKAVCTGREDKPLRSTTSANKIEGAWVKVDDAYYKAGRLIYEKLADYCVSDVKATYDLYKKLSHPKKKLELGPFIDQIRKGMVMTQKMNERGVLVDRDWVDGINSKRPDINKKWSDLTRKTFKCLPTQGELIKSKIKAKGYKLKGLSKDDISASFRLNKDSVVNNKIKKFLKGYKKYNTRSLSKIDKLNNTILDDNLMKHSFKFCGAAATGRYSSFGVQLQNLPRPMKGFSIEDSAEFLSSEDTDPAKTVASIRGCFVPRPGKKFFIADLSQIELRRVLDKAGYHDKVKLLSEDDSYDEYSIFASALFNKEVTKNDEERNYGKIFILAIGYGLGLASFIDKYEQWVGGTIDMAGARHYRDTYRETYPKVTALWRSYDKLIMKAYTLGKPLMVKLASGRYLNYGKLKKIKVKGRDGKTFEGLAYWNGTKWKGIYGAGLFQNVIQAECRDILLIKMNAIWDKGANIVMTVHDEVIVEVDEDADINKLSRMWAKAGAKEIKALFPTMYIDSDCVLTDRYWSH